MWIDGNPETVPVLRHDDDFDFDDVDVIVVSAYDPWKLLPRAISPASRASLLWSPRWTALAGMILTFAVSLAVFLAVRV